MRSECLWCLKHKFWSFWNERWCQIPKHCFASSVANASVVHAFRACARWRAGDGWVGLHVLPWPWWGHVPLEGRKCLHHRGGGHSKQSSGTNWRSRLWCNSARWTFYWYCGHFFKAVFRHIPFACVPDIPFLSVTHPRCRGKGRYGSNCRYHRGLWLQQFLAKNPKSSSFVCSPRVPAHLPTRGYHRCAHCPNIPSEFPKWPINEAMTSIHSLLCVYLYRYI